MANADEKGFGVNCPHCHDPDATITIDLNDIDDCHCSSCDESFSAEEARDMAQAEAARWQTVLEWQNQARRLLAQP